MRHQDHLKVEDLKIRFYTYEGVVKAVEDATFSVERGETLGIVGETGSGKSVTALTIMALTPQPGRVEAGKVMYRDSSGRVVNVLELPEELLIKLRGSEISIIFQEPHAALNPVYTVRQQIEEVFLAHRTNELLEEAMERLNRGKRGLLDSLELRNYRSIREGRRDPLISLLKSLPLLRKRLRRSLDEVLYRRSAELLKSMGIPDVDRVLRSYPHELSGGMQQRVMIAIALASSPSILIADEPTTNLDVTIQAQILELIREHKERIGASVIYVSHDLGVIAEICDKVAVMYAGNVVEISPVKEFFRDPLHPYSRALLESIPRPGSPMRPIPGNVPNMIDPPPGCRFHPRCPFAMEVCRQSSPRLIEVRERRFVACFLYEGGEPRTS